MDDGAPTLEVGFAIDTGGSFESLTQLDNLIDRATASAVAEFAKVERASAGMLNLGGATASIGAFGSASTRAGADAARALAQAEKAGEALSRQLDRQASTFGKTREEIRAMKVETAALAAEQQGLTELAGRLRAKEEDLYAAELAAARKLRAEVVAAAEDKDDAARRAAAAAEMEAKAVREAAFAYQMFEAAARKGMAAHREQQAAQATIAAEAEAQAIREASLAYQLFEARARQGLAAMKEAEREAATFEATMGRVQGRVDPAAVAITKLKTELDEAKLAFDKGRLGAEAYEQEQARVAAAASKLYGPQRQLAASTEEVGVAQRFTASETLNLSRQFQDIGVTAAMGMNPFIILAQQGPQIYDVLEQAKARGVGAGAAFAQMGQDILEAVKSLSILKTAGAEDTQAAAGNVDAASESFTDLKEKATEAADVVKEHGGKAFQILENSLTGANIAIFAAVAALALLAKAMGNYNDALQRFETTATGLGRVSGETAQQLEAISEAAAAAGQRSIGATRDSVNAFAEAGIQGEQTLTSLAANVERYAKLTGQDVPTAQAALAEAMKDPAQAADTFTQQLGLLTGAQYEHIRQLAAQGDQEKATAELTRILTGDLEANANQTTGLAHVMDLLGGAVAGVSNMFGRLDQRIKAAGASYDAWLKQHAGGWAVDLFGTGNQAPQAPNPNAGRNQDQIAALNASQSMNTSGMKQINDLLAQRRLLQKGLADTTGLTAVQVEALRHDYVAVTDTLNANRTASGAWITTQERAHLIAQAQDKLASARTQKEKAAAQQQITRLQLGTQVLTQQERQTQAMDAYNKVADKYVKPRTDHHADTLAREAEAIEAQIKNLYALGTAYAASGADALVAEARVKAESQAIKQRADIEAAVERQIRLAIAQRVSDAEKGAASIREQARIQAEVNGEVANGLVPAAQAGELVRQRIAELPLLAALEVAEQKGYKAEIDKANTALQHQREAQAAVKAAATGDFFVQAEATAGKRLAELREEGRLVGATTDERVRAMATLHATQDLQARGFELGTTYADKYIADQVAIADQQQANTAAQDAYNDSLSFTANLFDAIDQSAQRAAQGMSDAFGNAGAAIGDALTSVTSYYAQQASLQQAHDAAIKKAAGNQAQIARENALYATRSAGAQVEAYGDIASAAKGLFETHSTGYKAMEAAEKAFRALELALAIKNALEQVGLIGTHVAAKVVGDTAMAASDTARAGVEQSNSLATTAVKAVEAVVNAIKSLPFPANIAAGAATAAAIAALGITVAGGWGGSHKVDPGNTGTGTVLGDPSAKSDSIKNAIDALKEVDLLTNSYSRQMAASLRSIDSQIGGVAAQIVKGGDAATGSGVTEGFKANAIGSVLGAIPLIGGFLSSLFGSKTTVTASGLYGGAQSLGSILSSGFNASTYSDVTKTSKFLGITTGTKSSTQYGALDSDLQNQFTLILKSFDDAILAAAGPLGAATTDIQNRLNGFVVNLGKIDLKDLTGTEIQEKLTAVFGAAADSMAAAAFPGIERFQKVGEGLFETLVRVSSTLEQVGTSLDLLGTGAQQLGIDAKLGLADQFDSISDLTSAADAYFQAFYSQEEQAAAKTAQLAKVFGSLGLAMPDTLAGFRQLVEAQDLTTTAGQATYATLLQLAPAFADLQSSMQGAKSAADILSERQDLQRQLLELQGDTAAIRALDLAKLDASNRALQEQIYAIQDAQEAAEAADELRQAWTSVGDSIMDEVKRIRGLSDAGGGNSFATLLGQFNAANASARAGDMDAAKSLPALSQALLSAAADAATSRQELARVQAQTAAALEATYGVVGALTTSTSTSTTAQVTAAAESQGATTPTETNDDLVSEIKSLRDEVSQLRSENNSGHAATAANTGRVAKRLDDVTAQSGGSAITIMVEAA